MTVQDPRASPSEVGSRSVLAELLVIVETTTALQPQIESVLRACLTPEPKGVALAQKGGQLNATLAHLLDRADRLPRTWIVEEARGLLQYHHRLLAETVSRAYSVSAIFTAGRWTSSPATSGNQWPGCAGWATFSPGT